eukprot:11483289-Karenia_brevis.AAC.1
MPKCKSLDEVFGRITDLQNKYLEYEEVRQLKYEGIEKKADILRVVPIELQQRLQLEIDDLDDIKYDNLIMKIHNYIRSMGKGRANMDIGGLDEKEDYKEQDREQRKEEPAEYREEYEELNYMGGKGGKGDKGNIGNGGKGGKGFRGKCWYCEKPGHRADECWNNPDAKGKGKGKGSKGEYPQNKGEWGQGKGKGSWGPAYGGKGWPGKGIKAIDNHPYWDPQWGYIQDLGCIEIKTANTPTKEETIENLSISIGEKGRGYSISSGPTSAEETIEAEKEIVPEVPKEELKFTRVTNNKKKKNKKTRFCDKHASGCGCCEVLVNGTFIKQDAALCPVNHDAGT